MLIRNAAIADLDAVTDIERRCFPPLEAAGRAAFEERLTVYPDRFWLGLEDGRPVAFVNGFLTDDVHLTDEMFADARMHRPDGCRQMIFGVDTLPEYRGRGFATAILRQVIAQCRAEGRAEVVLTCKDALVGFYARLGFVDEGICDSTHGGVSWHEMRLRL